ncbi:MAG: hypothetical protein JNM74_20300 [Myxococcales bacterium]|nr:hypothetical protein [Myxococcales bacterium]
MRRILLLALLLGISACGGSSSVPPAGSTSTSGSDAPGDAVALASTSLVALRGQWGKAFFIDCAADASGSVWGTDVYTDDSDPCRAAVHAGQLAPATAGRVNGYIAPPLGHYRGSTRGGVTSLDYGAWPGAFQFARPDPATFPPTGVTVVGWSDAATTYREMPGTHVVWCPPGGEANTVWGAGPYTDDSSMCTAAVHAGAISLAGGGSVTIRTASALRAYPGTAQNGVTSLDYGAYEHAFDVVR